MVAKKMGHNENPVVIVVSPLVTLMEDQVKEATEMGIMSMQLGVQDEVDITGGSCQLLFGSPESWLLNKKWRDMLGSDVFHANVIVIVVDEVHLTYKCSQGTPTLSRAGLGGAASEWGNPQSSDSDSTPTHLACLPLSAPHRHTLVLFSQVSLSPDRVSPAATCQPTAAIRSAAEEELHTCLHNGVNYAKSDRNSQCPTANVLPPPTQAMCGQPSLLIFPLLPLPPRHTCLLLFSSLPIRRNLIGNQSFWWKNGVGLSVTVPWVLPGERGVQKRLYTGTEEGKYLSLLLSPHACTPPTCPLYSPTQEFGFLEEKNGLSESRGWRTGMGRHTISIRRLPPLHPTAQAHFYRLLSTPRTPTLQVRRRREKEREGGSTGTATMSEKEEKSSVTSIKMLFHGDGDSAVDVGEIRI
ncbi:unnamed protein product [Pleuronectes platessa]|uniref:Helicase ATP-binding domain-containing protein n=1 Tax=Pleuronectes platessa TaxID=8262 RepID=A0A9N7U2U3_PLEPL|nr:unnamed protein product [Pleuronectes platessa]